MAYASEAGMDLIFGSSNIDQWADIDSDGSAVTIAARKAQAIIIADAQIDDVVRLTGYKTPLVTAAGATPTTVADLASRLAGFWLYEGRGAQDFNPKSGEPYHRYAFMSARARRLLEQLRVGDIKLDAVMGG